MDSNLPIALTVKSQFQSLLRYSQTENIHYKAAHSLQLVFKVDRQPMLVSK